MDIILYIAQWKTKRQDHDIVGRYGKYKVNFSRFYSLVKSSQVLFTFQWIY